MTDDDRDRGAYSPSGQHPPSFDPRRNGYGGAGRPPLTLLISAGILLVLIVVLIAFYSRGVRGPDQPPMVGSSLGEIVQPPPASANPAPDEAAGLQIYKAEDDEADSSAPITVAPAPEQPLPRGAQPTQPAAAPKPALTPTPGPVSAELRTTPAPARTPSPAVAASSGGPVVQIGALSSPTLADKAWNDVAKLLPGDMVGRTKRVEPVASNGATLYRAFVGGFASKAEAAAFCDRLKAQGKGCFVK
jgi:cell division protein FtsN